MSESFAVAVTTQKVVLSKELGKPQTGTATYIITNKTVNRLEGRVKIVPLNNSMGDWFSIDNLDMERTYAPNETYNVVVIISVPSSVSAGTYQFRLDAFSVDNPEDDYTEGQIVEFEVSQIIEKKVNWLLPLIIGVVLLMIAIVTFSILTSQKKIKVPPITGLSYRQAVDSLKKLSLTDSLIPGFFPTDTNEWLVVDQQPANGARVEKKTKINLTIEPGVVVPNVIGQTETAGKNILESNGFTTAKAGVRDIGTAVGTIIETKPAAGFISGKGKNIRYFIDGIPESCLDFKTENLEIRPNGSLFVLTDGTKKIKVFPNSADADRVFQIIQHYRINRFCFMNDPVLGQHVLEYWVNGDKAPEGVIAGEDCNRFDPASLIVRTIILGDRQLFLLQAGPFIKLGTFKSRSEAETARKLFVKYGFNQFCFVGSPDPSMTYYRK